MDNSLPVSAPALIDNVHYTLVRSSQPSSLLIIVIHFSEDMEKIFLNKPDGEHNHYSSLENATLTYLYAVF